MGDVSILVKRLISARVYFVMLNFYFEFHAILWGFYKQKFLMLKFLNLRRHVRCLSFPLVKTVFELNFSARHTEFWSAI